MPVIDQTIRIAAPREIVFDLSRSIDLHTESTAQTNERAIAGCTSGLIGEGEFVTFSAVHFGVRQHLTSLITEFDRPTHFRDSMVKGAFRRFDHDHFFQNDESGTVVRDVFDYTSLRGPFGILADALFLKRYLSRMLAMRNEYIRAIAESGKADRYLTVR